MLGSGHKSYWIDATKQLSFYLVELAIPIPYLKML